jgi:hypothetical protein
MAARCETIPIFTASTPSDEFRRYLMDGDDTSGVLGGQGGDDRRAIDSEGRERFEVGLNPGAAARVRTRNGHGDWRHA